MGKVDGRMGLPVAVGSRCVYFYLRILVIEIASFDREKWPPQNAQSSFLISA